MSYVYDDEFQLPDDGEQVPNCNFDMVEDMPTALKRFLATKKNHETRETDDTPSTGQLSEMFREVLSRCLVGATTELPQGVIQSKDQSKELWQISGLLQVEAYGSTTLSTQKRQ
jgi:hypothetical protein